MTFVGIDALYSATGSLAYSLIFILAATPWIEILVVIPLGIAIGLDPFTVALLAFAGNLTTIYLLIFTHHVLQKIWKGFKISENNTSLSGRKMKALHLWNRYGLPGVAIISPIATGTHLAALIALSLGSKRYTVALWMTFSIFMWTVVVTIASYYGIESLKWFLR